MVSCWIAAAGDFTIFFGSSIWNSKILNSDFHVGCVPGVVKILPILTGLGIVNYQLKSLVLIGCQSSTTCKKHQPRVWLVLSIRHSSGKQYARTVELDHHIFGGSGSKIQKMFWNHPHLGTLQETNTYYTKREFRKIIIDSNIPSVLRRGGEITYYFSPHLTPRTKILFKWLLGFIGWA